MAQRPDEAPGALMVLAEIQYHLRWLDDCPSVTEFSLYEYKLAMEQSEQTGYSALEHPTLNDRLAELSHTFECHQQKHNRSCDTRKQEIRKELEESKSIYRIWAIGFASQQRARHIIMALEMDSMQTDLTNMRHRLEEITAEIESTRQRAQEESGERRQPHQHLPMEDKDMHPRSTDGDEEMRAE